MTEKYSPTTTEILAIRPKDGYLKLSGDGIFATRQGEGVTAGKSAVFIRLHFCNLACGRDGGWKCDTGYTWDERSFQFWQEPYDLEISAAALAIKNSWNGASDEKRLVITGGEPMLQQRKIAKLLGYLPGWAVEIETNGTVLPLPDLSNCQFNCSPKLSNSGNSLNRRFRPDVLRNIALLPNSYFKFVVTNANDLDEIDQIARECSLPCSRVLIMPEGRDAAKISRQAGLLSGQVLRRGYKITLRNQLIWFGDTRRT